MGGIVGGNYADGWLANAAVWNVQLNAEERASYFNGYSPLLIRPSALVVAPDLIRSSRDPITGLTATTDDGIVVAHPRTHLPASPYIVDDLMGAYYDAVTADSPKVWLR